MDTAQKHYRTGVSRRHRLSNYTLCLKKTSHLYNLYNFYIHSSIETIFGTNVAEKVGNQNILYFPTSPN